jgi:HSP20 family protein
MMLHRFDPFADPYRPTARRSSLDADVYRLGDTFYVEIDAPGVQLEDIDLELEKQHLSITVERRELADEERTDIVRGRATGTFRRRFFLGDSLAGDQVEASFDNGVLTLAIPVIEEAKPRKIVIETAAAN